MKQAHTSRLTLLLMVTAAGILAAALLLWGTEYKVSLYRSPSKAPASMPRAKLLSEKERAVAAERLQARMLPPLACLTVWFTASAAQSGMPTRSRGPQPRRRTLQDRHRYCCLSRFSFRPPPAFALQESAPHNFQLAASLLS